MGFALRMTAKVVSSRHEARTISPPRGHPRNPSVFGISSAGEGPVRKHVGPEAIALRLLRRDYDGVLFARATAGGAKVFIKSFVTGTTAARSQVPPPSDATRSK